MQNANSTIRKGLLGFSLLEVLVALALLAISFTSLLLVQARATDLALQARNLSIATQLARLQLVECKKAAIKAIPSVGDLNLEGTFAELGFEKFTWECHAPKFNMKMPSASELDDKTKKKASPDKKDKAQSSASTMSPILSLVTDSLGNAVRELVLIVRWGEGEAADEVRVPTHVVDLTPMNLLGRMLKQGLQTTGDSQNRGQPGAVEPPSEGGPMGGGRMGGGSGRPGPMGGGPGRPGPMGGGPGRPGPMGGGPRGPGPMGGGPQ